MQEIPTPDLLHLQAEMDEDDILGRFKPMMKLPDRPAMTCSDAIRACARGFKAPYIEESLKEVKQILESLVESPSFSKAVLELFRAKARGDDPEAEAMGKVAAIIMYTFDVRNVRPEEGLQRSDTFFDKLNISMRARSCEAGFLGFLYYLMNGLEELPSYNASGTLWRGIRLSAEKRAKLAEEYSVGRTVTWSGFTSASVDETVSMGFAGSDEGGVLIKIGILQGGKSRSRDISMISAFSNEKEVLLLPNIKLVVTSGLEMDSAGGVWRMQLQEMAQGKEVRF
jgi:hypothetical protein